MTISKEIDVNAKLTDADIAEFTFYSTLHFKA